MLASALRARSAHPFVATSHGRLLPTSQRIRPIAADSTHDFYNSNTREDHDFYNSRTREDTMKLLDILCEENNRKGCERSLVAPKSPKSSTIRPIVSKPDDFLDVYLV